MGPDQWDRVRELFHAALDLPVDERPAFLRAACDDPELRNEVERLLDNAGDTAGDQTGLLDAPAAEGLRAALESASAGAAPGLARPGSLRPGVILKGRYHLERQLGQGAFGKVFLAADQQLHSRRVVVKALLDANTSDAWFVKRFAEEIHALSRIDHPGVVAVLDSGRMDDGTPYLVMQFADGVSLRSLIEPGGMLFARVSDLVRQIAQGLEAAHEQGITHHDLKPDNIMVQKFGSGEERVRLIDFGIARLKPENAEAGSMTEHTRVAGSPSYMSPEQLTGHGSTESDIYSLGVVAFELLTGRKPFEARNPLMLYQMQSAGACTKPRSLRPDLPESAESVLLRALAFDPAERPASAREFATALAEALEAAAPEPEPEVVAAAAEYDVFVSHSSRDLELATRLVVSLEKRKIRCFISPRDLPAGGLLPAAIAEAALNSRCFLLLLTENANASVQLARETELANSASIPFLAIHVDGCEPSGGLALFLTSPHRVNVSAALQHSDLDKIERSLRASAGAFPASDFVPKPHPPPPPKDDEPLFTEFGRIPRFLRPGMRRVRVIAWLSIWTVVTCILSALANTGYITVVLQAADGRQLFVHFGYLYELNGAFAYLFIVPWFIYCSIGFVLDAQAALTNLASRDQVVVNRVPLAARTPVALIGEAHRQWMSRRLLGFVFLLLLLIIVGTEYLPPKSDYQHVMFGYVQAPWIAEYPQQCPNCTLLDLEQKLGRRIEPLSRLTPAQLADYRIVKPYYVRNQGKLGFAAYVLFMISVLGLEVTFGLLLVWTAINAFFILQLIYRAVVPSETSVIGLHLRYTDPARMFGLESIHRALRPLVASILLSALLQTTAWWTNITKGSRRTLGEDLYSLGGWGQFLISNSTFVMAVALLIYLFYIGGKAHEAASEESRRLAEAPRRGRDLDELLGLIAEQSIWRSPRYTVPYLLAPLVCVASVLILNRPGVAQWIGAAWELFLKSILGME